MLEAGPLLADFSRTEMKGTLLAELLHFAESSPLAEKMEKMLNGDILNVTENRAAGHIFLRDEELEHAFSRVAQEEKAKMLGLVEEILSGERLSSGGKAFTHVINIGIGGSDLGPAMATKALEDFKTPLQVHYVSNVDGCCIQDVMKCCPPETTLIIISSKTFTTQESLQNAATARSWLEEHLTGDVPVHFFAVTACPQTAENWGLPASHILTFQEWVGGRFSIWSSIGFSLALSIGTEHFKQFLQGGRDMDRHFFTTAYSENIPVLLALHSVLNRNVRKRGSLAVLPYSERLSLFPAYLQQLEMESNGKRVTMDGADLPRSSGPVVWGEPGTNGQHAFYQLIHQGTQIVPCEFIVAARGEEPALDHHQRLLIANCLAQSRALMRGRTLAEARARMAAKGLSGPELERQARHRVFPGNRPSTTLLIPRLTPFTLGQVVALYEHRVFVEGVILGINSFDQWGVELGKELALQLAPLLEGAAPGADQDGSTRALVARVQALRG